MASSGSITQVGDGDLERARRVLAASFDDDPMFRFLLPAASKRRRWLHAFMAEALLQCARTRMVFAPGAGPDTGAMGLLGPGEYPPEESTLAFMLGLGGRPFPGLPTWRLLSTGMRVVGDMVKVHPTYPHLYIMVVGVAPSHKGRGLGRALLEHAAALADADAVPAYLETTNPVNLGFYARFGFEVVREVTYARAPSLWTMQRPVP